MGERPSKRSVEWSGPELRCPECRVELARTESGVTCSVCERRYPVVAGIPDLRLAGDRYLSLADDRAKAERLAAVRGRAADVVRAYWAMTPEVPDSLAQRYRDRAFEDKARAAPHLNALAALGADHGSLVDVGCGTGGLLIAAARRGMTPVGVDHALRWLVIARRALDDAGMDAPLVAADGGLLPFAPGSFDAMTCIETLEHAEDQRGLLNGCLRVVRAGGGRYLVTANRLSIAPEPVSGLVGVGYLPRAWAPGYVRRRTGTRYQFFRAVSPSELRSWCPATVRVGPAVLPIPSASASDARRGLQRAYERVRTSPGGRLLTWITPYLQVTG